MSEKKNIIKEKSYKFAIDIVRLYKTMIEQNEFILSKQIVRSCTSIGANIEEAEAAQSRKDFISKMSIASKEARETNYWLRLIRDTKLLKYTKIKKLINDSEEIVKIITSIVKTTQKNSKLTIEIKNYNYQGASHEKTTKYFITHRYVTICNFNFLWGRNGTEENHIQQPQRCPRCCLGKALAKIILFWAPVRGLQHIRRCYGHHEGIP
jgi:four helix bundle protein